MYLKKNKLNSILIISTLFLFVFSIVLSTPDFAEAARKRKRKIKNNRRPSIQRIVGGIKADVINYQSMASLIQQNSQTLALGPLCGGNLISPQWVLTAGHCIVNGLKFVGFGKNFLPDLGGQENSNSLVGIEKLVIHPGFNETTLSNDIALIKLKTPVSYEPGLVANMFATNFAIDKEVISRVIGYGNTSEAGKEANFFLNKVDVKIWSQNKCAAAYEYAKNPLNNESENIITNTKFCAGWENGLKDACQGDSGGPLFVRSGTKLLQIGIVSSGAGCARPNAPGIYTKVSSFLTWIDNTIKSN